MPSVVVDLVLAAVLGILAAGFVAAIIVPRLPAGEFEPLLVGFILACVGVAFALLRRRRRRLARES